MEYLEDKEEEVEELELEPVVGVSTGAEGGPHEECPTEVEVVEEEAAEEVPGGQRPVDHLQPRTTEPERVPTGTFEPGVQAHLPEPRIPSRFLE